MCTRSPDGPENGLQARSEPSHVRVTSRGPGVCPPTPKTSPPHSRRASQSPTTVDAIAYATPCSVSASPCALEHRGAPWWRRAPDAHAETGTGGPRYRRQPPAVPPLESPHPAALRQPAPAPIGAIDGQAGLWQTRRVGAAEKARSQSRESERRKAGLAERCRFLWTCGSRRPTCHRARSPCAARCRTTSPAARSGRPGRCARVASTVHCLPGGGLLTPAPFRSQSWLYPTVAFLRGSYRCRCGAATLVRSASRSPPLVLVSHIISSLVTHSSLTRTRHSRPLPGPLARGRDWTPQLGRRLVLGGVAHDEQGRPQQLSR